MSVWGAVQDRKIVAPGIEHVSTASHGGYLLNAERNDKVRALFPNFTPWGGQHRCYEEDQDWALVPLAFPEFFDDRTVYHAVLTVQRDADYFEDGPAFLSSEAGQLLVHRAIKYADDAKMENTGLFAGGPMRELSSDEQAALDTILPPDATT